MAVAGIVGWADVRHTAAAQLPIGSPVLDQLAPGDARVILGRATRDIAAPDAKFDDRRFSALAAAIAQVPLDERPFIFESLRETLAGNQKGALALAEEARRRNPRNRLTRLVLLDKYLRNNAIADATVEMAVLSRLMSGSALPLAAELARRAKDPTVRTQIRRVLGSDPEMLGFVLSAMAKNGTEPDIILQFAGTGAPDGLEPGGWREQMIQSRVTAGDFSKAKRLWADGYNIPASERAALLFNPQIRQIPAAGPFNWRLIADPTGAAESNGGGLAVYYYGRRDGTLAEQLLTLTPGRYRLAFVGEGSGGDGAPALFWSLSCPGSDSKPFAEAALPRFGPNPRKMGIEFEVPSQCAAQWLRLSGRAGDLATSTTARMAQLRIERLS